MTSMAKKLGCGPLMAIFIIAFILLGVAANEGVEHYYVNCPDEELMDCLMGQAEEEEPEPESVVATGTYTYKGYSVDITMNIPLGGGNVVGSVSGTCEGSIKGSFNAGVLSGNMSGVCAPFFVNIPASAEMTGSVNKSGKTVPVSFNGRGGGITHDGSVTLTYP